VDLEAGHEVIDNRQVQVDKPFAARRQQLLHKPEMVPEIRSIPIGALKAVQMLSRPVPLIANSYLVNVLLSKTLSPNRDGQPQGALIVF